MTKTRAFALFVAVVGTLLYLKTVFYPPTRNWEEYNKAGLTASGREDYAEAEIQLAAALKEAEKFSLDYPRLTLSLNNLAEIYRTQAKYAEAEPYIKRSVEIAENIYGREHPIVAAYLNNLAENYRVRAMYAEAEPLSKRALDIWEKALGREDPLVLSAMKNHADLLRKLGRDAEAESYETRLKLRQAIHEEDKPANESSD